jgi:hypothetical protein
MKMYRATLSHLIVFPEKSVLITVDNLNSIDFDKVIYCEVSPKGAMGNEGGILLYLRDDQDTLFTYETNESLDKESYEVTSRRIDEHKDLFEYFYGGMGNYVYVKKGTQLQIDKENNCFWYFVGIAKQRIDSSVKGVFLEVISQME